MLEEPVPALPQLFSGSGACSTNFCRILRLGGCCPVWGKELFKGVYFMEKRATNVWANCMALSGGKDYVETRAGDDNVPSAVTCGRFGTRMLWGAFPGRKLKAGLLVLSVQHSTGQVSWRRVLSAS